MVDSSKFGESDYLGVELIKTSPSRKGYVLQDAEVETGKFGDRLVLTIEIDGKKKKWTLSKDSVKSMQFAFGVETKNWIGQTVGFRVINANGKELILSIPEIRKEEVM